MKNLLTSRTILTIAALAVLMPLFAAPPGCGGDGSSGQIPGTAPPAPTAIRTTAINMQTRIEWSGVSGATSYNIYWSTTPNAAQEISSKISGIETIQYLHSNPAIGTYYYVVTAVNEFGEGLPSPEVQVTLSGNMTASVIAPAAGGVVSDNLLPAMSITSEFEVKSVDARVEDRVAGLSYGSTVGAWTGNISLTGLARGRHMLIITASDVFGNTAAASASFVYDNPPGLNITEPKNGSVARPQLRVSASCLDDNPTGCSSISVYASENVSGSPRTLLVSGQSSIDKIISLPMKDGSTVTLTFEARDSLSQKITGVRTVYIDSSSRLVEITTTGGPIWDVADDRMLYLDESTSPAAVKIRSLVTGADILISSVENMIPISGYLTPRGALVVEKSAGSSAYALYEWRDGALVSLGPIGSKYSLVVEGSYAVWTHGIYLYLRELTGGITTTIDPDAWGWYVSNYDVGANGDLVWYSLDLGDLFRYREGVVTRLNTACCGEKDPYVVTDGINIVYRTPGIVPEPGYEIRLYDAAGNETVLSQARADSVGPPGDYQVRDGWVAFTRASATVYSQVWLRNPLGEETQISFFGTWSSISTLGGAGNLTFVNSGRLYAAGPALSPTVICSSLGRSFYLNDRWYVVIGSSLFAVQC